MIQILSLIAVAASQFVGGFPGQGFQGQGFPDQGLPGQGFPGQGFPGQGIPSQGIPIQGFPDQFGSGIAPGQGIVAGQNFPISGNGQVEGGTQVESTTVQAVQPSRPAPSAGNGQVVRERGGRFRNSGLMISNQLWFLTALLI